MINKELQKRILSSLIIIPIVFFFIIKGSVFFVFFLGIFLLATAYEWLKMNKKRILKFLGIIYLVIITYLAYLLRNDLGLNIFIFVMIICIFTDIGGYIFGKILKGPKLTKISPNKTYAGVLGSFVFPIVACSIYAQLQGSTISFSSYSIFDVKFFLFQYDELKFILIVLFISLISQIGDLIVSYFKRLSKVKDTGNLLPGHGGLLDRVDGIIFAIPVSYLLFNYLS
tara:strand:+ start:37 stop:717 length:681 start_codon:yes stop_codon:yes gene_type:complete